MLENVCAVNITLLKIILAYEEIMITSNGTSVVSLKLIEALITNCYCTSSQRINFDFKSLVSELQFILLDPWHLLLLAIMYQRGMSGILESFHSLIQIK